MEPLLVNEKLVSFFKFWANGKLQTGMSCYKELFRQVRTFGFDQRQKVYSLGWALAERGVRVVITWSLQGYGLWICLRPNKLWKASKETQPSPAGQALPTATSFSRTKTAPKSFKETDLRTRVLAAAR